ncbi:hypothetical protein [Roseateles saccharophilus]|uniref:Uncharacterized protein n=1 Tax=Roseateles saccharophilus TaxID=304 RepID=A0A4R3UKS4_ROSSA|nr:hypothetical protein [Roseateles saccharophilus]MDG0834435.1 hypothetical protein [Roseateles saccharophilus]TCU89853.1 hypothetical protein EV671_103232 [Roseateles saccharophilus]
MATTPKPPRSTAMPTAALPADGAGDDANEPLDDDFHFVLGELLAAYKPVLAADLQRADSPDALIKDALANPPSCEDEFAQAMALFERFSSEEVAQRVLPAAVREQLGPLERWRWCLLHLRCCIVFGWLMCRGPRSFRGSSYYLWRYWRCVREVLGAPVANPPTAAERADFNHLVKALAEAYKPYLDDQLASVEFTQGLPEQVLAGQVDCFEDGDANTQILERLLSTDTAAALMGRELIAKHRADPLYWFCRCWALCAIRFGCCLARARNLRDVFRCLRGYRACLRRCQRPLHCALTAPAGCVRGETDILPGRILEAVRGDAEGTGFGHYLIEVRSPGGSLLGGVVVYPNNLGLPDVAATQGNFSVAGGNLGWVDTRKCAVDAGIELLSSTTFTLTLRVFSASGAELQPPCTGSFALSVNEVYIKRVSTPWSVDYPNPAEPLRAADSAAAALSTVGGGLHVRGAANVYGCAGEKIREYTIWAIPDPTFSEPQPAPFTSIVPGGGWRLVTHIEFNPMSIAQPSGPPINYTADQVRASNVLDGNPLPSILTNVWGSRSECICVHIDSTNFCTCWNVPSLEPAGFDSNSLPRQDPPHQQGGTGKFSVLLQVIDTAGNSYYDIQRAWIDNEPIQAAVVGIGNQAPCSDMYTQTHEGIFKTVDIRGYAWDQYIDRGDLSAPTSDNFDSYQVRFTKQGAVSPQVMLINSTNTVPARALALPAESLATGTLTPWNLQVLDAASNPLGLPADQLLGPGEACVYVVVLEAWDKTVVDEGTVHYSGWKLFPIKIINGPEPL